jgi:large subunit ribosomal protein L25
MTAQLATLKAQNRTPAGKTEARRVRRQGMVPAIAYGRGLPSTAIAVPPKEVARILMSERGQNTVVELEMEGRKILAMIREFELHPVKRELVHVDFIEVKLDRPVDVHVPLHATGKAVGVTKGGVLRVVYRTLPVRCLPDRIPVKLETDVAHLELGMHVSTKELKLPEGVSVLLPPEQTLVSVVAPEKEEVVEAVAAVPGAPGAAPAAGAAGAGAATAAPAAGAGAGEAAAGGKDEKKKK